MMTQRGRWTAIVREVARIVRIMPLWKLQTVGREQLDFLYENTGTGKTIELKPGVAVCFRKFHAQVSGGHGNGQAAHPSPSRSLKPSSCSCRANNAAGSHAGRWEIL
jgi:hypothetical protein